MFTKKVEWIKCLTNWGRVTHICVGKLSIIGPDNGLSPGRRQAIIRTNAGTLLIRPLGTNFSEILIEILIFSFKKMRLKVSSAKRWPFCLGLNVLIGWCQVTYLIQWTGSTEVQGWGLLSQLSPFRYLPHFPLLSKQTLAIEHHVYIWQVSPQLSCGDTCQIWMWFRESNRYFCKIKNFAYGEISEP